jgi:ABC-type sugar transport system permease subunit
VDDIRPTQRWVGTRDSARQAAGEFVRVLVRRPWWWGLVAVLQLGYAVLFALAIDERSGLWDRVLWGTVYALVLTMCVVVLILGASYFVNRRRFQQRLREGVLLEASLGEQSVTLRSPWAEHTLSFDGLSRVTTSGDWVFLKQKGAPTWAIWPAELFPPDDLARLQRSVAGQKS